MWDKLANNNPNNKFLKIMGNKKFRSVLYLFLWIILIGIIYIVVINPLENYSDDNNNVIANETGEINEEIMEVTIEEKWQKLLNNNYSYVFKYNDVEVYKGDLLNDKSTGYFENSDGIKRYIIDNKQEYFVNFGILSETSYDEKFDTFFNVSYIFNLIKDHFPIVVDNVYNYKIEDNYIKILVDDSNIKTIEVSWADNNYVLEFSSIGQIKNIEY